MGKVGGLDPSLKNIRVRNREWTVASIMPVRDRAGGLWTDPESSAIEMQEGAASSGTVDLHDGRAIDIYDLGLKRAFKRAA